MLIFNIMFVFMIGIMMLERNISRLHFRLILVAIGLNICDLAVKVIETGGLFLTAAFMLSAVIGLSIYVLYKERKKVNTKVFGKPIYYSAVIILGLCSLPTIKDSLKTDSDTTVINMYHYYEEINRIFKGEMLENEFIYDGEHFVQNVDGQSQSYAVPKGKPFVFGERIFMYEEGTGDLLEYSTVELADPDSIDLNGVRMIIREDSYIMQARYVN